MCLRLLQKECCIINLFVFISFSLLTFYLWLLKKIRLNIIVFKEIISLSFSAMFSSIRFWYQKQSLDRRVRTINSWVVWKHVWVGFIQIKLTVGSDYFRSGSLIPICCYFIRIIPKLELISEMASIKNKDNSPIVF